jgi:Fe-S-cluster containining protein
MQDLEQKALEVAALFKRLDEHIEKFQSWSTLQCKFGCGKCCFKPDIEATVLEFLPFAYHLYQTGLAEQWLEKLSEQDAICKILNPTQAGAGLCTEYPYRGLICRLFGYSARTNKYGKKELITCQIIKTEQESACNAASTKIENEEAEIPVMSQYYMQLHSIDPEMAKNFYPINIAIRKAVEEVLHYFAYR